MADPGPSLDLHHPRYPRSNGYDARWVVDNQMGPNALWLMEALTEGMRLETGMHVLDLGCGRAMTSVFLAREFGVRVTAADLWIPAEENQVRIEEAGVADLVTAVHAEAHQLPLQRFDAILSVDAYHYFGTNDLYLGEMTLRLVEGGRLGIAVPCVTREVDAGPPPALEPFWDWEFCSFHTMEWWRRHWEKTGLVRVERAEMVQDTAADWLRFGRASLPFAPESFAEMAARDVEMLEVDGGRLLGLGLVTATRIV